MRTFMAAIIGILCLSPRAQAQVQVYGFGGAGGISPSNAYTYWSGSTLTAGAGAEYIARHGLSLSGELEAIRRKTYFGESKTSGVASLDLGYHFKRAGEHKVVPFVSVGFSSITGINVGAGLNYWFSPRMALRAEGRNHVLLGSDTVLNVFDFRLGLTFRAQRP